MTVLPLIGCALAVLMLAGCVAEPVRSPSDRLEVKTAEAVMSYSFAGCSNGLTKSEQHQITGFLNSMHLRRNDTVVVSIPRACTARDDITRRKTIKGLMALYPSRLHIVQDNDFRQPGHAETKGIFRVVRAKGFRVQCGTSSPANGCSTAINLARMIGQPMDTMFPTGGSRYHAASSGKPQN